jgi:hypothetical protein
MIGSKSGNTIDGNGKPFIELQFPANDYATGMGLEVVGSGKHQRLEVELGDPDEPLTYNFAR